MGDPGTWSDFFSQTAWLIFFAFLLEFAARRWHPDTRVFSSPRPVQSALAALSSTIVGVGLIWLIFFSLTTPGDTSTEQVWNLSGVISQALIAAIMLAPAIVAMYVNHEGPGSVGYTTTNIGFALVVGVSLAAAGFFETGAGREWHVSFTEAQFWSFLHYAVVGFAEETLFRGYLQSRLENWLGSVPGWLIASLMMALAHIAQRMVMNDMILVDALISSLKLISISLFFGFLYMRTRNILAPGIAHTFANWLGTL